MSFGSREAEPDEPNVVSELLDGARSRLILLGNLSWLFHRLIDPFTLEESRRSRSEHGQNPAIIDKGRRIGRTAAAVSRILLSFPTHRGSSILGRTQSAPRRISPGGLSHMLGLFDILPKLALSAA
jgi:hypothetical protein